MGSLRMLRSVRHRLPSTASRELVEHGFRHRDWLQSDPALNRLHETRKFKRLLRALTVS